MNHFTLEDLNRVVESCVGADESAGLTPENLDLDFESVGLDSLALYEVVTVIEDDWKLKLGDEVLDAAKTPRALVEYVNQTLGVLRAA